MAKQRITAKIVRYVRKRQKKKVCRTCGGTERVG